jgi:hypothetical protein
MKKIDMSTVLCGFGTIGDMRHHPFILNGQCDHEISVALFYKQHDKLPTEDDLKNEWVLSALDKMKSVLRGHIQKEIDSLTPASDLRESPTGFPYIKTNMNIHAQAPEGTVSELAEKYNLSKSCIRKMKKEGRLSELGQDS